MYESLGRATSVQVRNLSRQAELGGPPDELRLGPHSELPVDGGEMRLDGALAHVEMLRDGLRRLASRCQHRDLALSAAEGLDADVRTAAGSALATGEEHLDLIGDRVDVAEPRSMLRPR